MVRRRFSVCVANDFCDAKDRAWLCQRSRVATVCDVDSQIKRRFTIARRYGSGQRSYSYAVLDVEGFRQKEKRSA
jgi:hypothetical protein